MMDKKPPAPVEKMKEMKGEKAMMKKMKSMVNEMAAMMDAMTMGDD